MKLFVGYGYNARDEWIEELVFPLIQSFDFEVESGKGLEGQSLSEQVKKRIEKSRAAIGFCTRRDPLATGGLLLDCSHYRRSSMPRLFLSHFGNDRSAARWMKQRLLASREAQQVALEL